MRLQTFFMLILAATMLPAQTIPWPPIGPDVTGGVGPGSHSHDVPAKRCYRATPIDHTFDGTPVAITSASWASGKVTIDFVGTASLTPTAIFTLAGISPAGYNGTYGINGQTFTVTMAQTTNPGAWVSGGAGSYGGSAITVTAASWSSNVQSVTFTAANAVTPTAATITLTGITPSGYNGTYSVTGQTSKVTFIQPTNPGFYVSGGTIQYTPNILAYDAKNCYAAY